MRASANLYQQDFYAWTQKQAGLISAGAFNELDIANLVEEVEGMGASEARELENRLELLLTHLLKWKYQPTHRGTSWESTIREQRRKIERRLQKMPSLKSQLPEAFIDAYDGAIYEASVQTNMPYRAFPETCEWAMEQVFDSEFFPS